MSIRKFRWSKVYESTEEELTDFFASRNIHAVEFQAEAFDKAEPRELDHESTIWCAEGSGSITVDSKTISMQPGDAFVIPAGTAFTIAAGLSGYICYES